MAYRFKLHEPLAQGVRRIGLEQIDAVGEKLGANGDRASAIHDARRSLKRLRALIRLVRPALGEEVYKREAGRAAAIGRLMAGARDLHVMGQTAAKLEGRPGALSSGTCERLQKLISEGAAELQPDAGAQACAEALQSLKHTRKFFAGRAIEGVDIQQVARGMERSYRKGRKAFRKAFRDADDEAFHSWRKGVQQHWRHMQLLSRAWPEALSARADEAKELSRMLGEDHDLAVLQAYVSQPDVAHLTKDDVAAVVSLCRSCQSEIRARAEPHGARLFAESADELRERIEAYWKSARHLAPPEEEAKPDGKAQPAKPTKPVRSRKPARRTKAARQLDDKPAE